MNDLRKDAFELTAEDGHVIHGTYWARTSTPVAILQILHGLGEHHQRYERFASIATQQDLAVICHDHRGHGPHASHPGFFAATNGWDFLRQDARQVSEYCSARHPDVPLILLGHSMASFLAQHYAMQYSESLAALILSASTWPEKSKTIPGHWLARLERMRLGARGESALLDKLGFGDFNKPFEPARTELDWLSRDPVEVDCYIADPYCGGPYSSSLWVDITAALNTIGKPGALQRIRSDLPILLTGGSDDPVGGERGITKLFDQYQASGHSNLSLKLYAGGRHEMFNEINRDAFSADILDWCAAQI